MSNFFKAVSNMKRTAKVVPEYMLYYNKKNGKPLFYSMNVVDGDFIIVDKEVYTQANYSVYINDGVLVTMVFKDISKLTQHGNETTCCDDDISIVSTKGTNWSLRSYDN
jgi:choline kinase